MIRSTVIAVIALTAPATALAAEPSATLAAVTTHGIVMKTSFGFEIPVTYAADGTFSAQPPGAVVKGRWRIDGRTLCTRLDTETKETCVAYPDGKGSGDVFDVDGAMGPAMGVITIRIR